MKISQRVKKILSHYESDCPGTKANLARILMHGRLGGSGHVVILPVDQGFEHGPARSFAPNPAAYDPHYHFRLAVDAGLNAFAAPLGMLRYNDAQMKATGPDGVATHIAAGSSFDEVIENRAWFCGTPQQMVIYLQELQDTYPGLQHIMIGFPMGLSKDQFTDQLTCFAEEVMPAFA